MRQTPRRFVRTAVIAALLATAGCDNGTEPTLEDIRDFISGLTTTSGGVVGIYRPGEAPTAGSGPAIQATGSSGMILGGSAIRSLSSSTPFDRVIVAIDDVDGYWELSLEDPVTTESIILSLGQEIPTSSFTVQYAGGTAGVVGTFDPEPVSLVEVGTGSVQVNVSWDSDADVDLYLVEPGGEEIFYGNPDSSSGGTLDLDSNAGCSAGVRNENITYPSVTPPRGSYTVRVNYWSSCDESSTRYVVTVRVQGQNPTTFTGTFTGDGNRAGEGAGTVVTSFTF